MGDPMTAATRAEYARADRAARRYNAAIRDRAATLPAWPGPRDVTPSADWIAEHDPAEPCLACGAPVTVVFTGAGHDPGCPTILPEYTGADVVAAIRAGGGIPAYIEQTGGGTATVYVGTPDAADRYALAVGPGAYDWGNADRSTFYSADLYIGPDDDGEAGAVQVRTLAELTDATRRLLGLLGGGLATDEVVALVQSAIPAWRCEGYNVAGVWTDCNRTDPHGHGIEAD